MIVLDTGAFALGAMAAVVRNARDRVLVIDHHVSEDDLSDRWFKDTASEATGRIVAEIAMRWAFHSLRKSQRHFLQRLLPILGGFDFRP